MNADPKKVRFFWWSGKDSEPPQPVAIVEPWPDKDAQEVLFLGSDVTCPLAQLGGQLTPLDVPPFPPS